MPQQTTIHSFFGGGGLTPKQQPQQRQPQQKRQRQQQQRKQHQRQQQQRQQRQQEEEEEEEEDRQPSAQDEDTRMDIDTQDTQNTEPSQALTWSESESEIESQDGQSPSLFFKSQPDTGADHTNNQESRQEGGGEEVRRGRGRGRGRGRPRGSGRGTRRGGAQGKGGGGSNDGTTDLNSQFQSAEEIAKTMPFRKNTELALVAKETLDVLPSILDHLPHIFADKAHSFRLQNLAPLDPDESPRHVPPGGAAPRTIIRVVNADTYDAALDMPRRIDREDRQWVLNSHNISQSQSQVQASPTKKTITGTSAGTSTSTALYGRVAVLNFASNYVAGGGWLKGARAQEEALCYRSSLYLSLNKDFYPLRQLNGIYTPDVVIIRSSMDDGHQLLHPDPVADPNDLPVVSVISIAALRLPALEQVQCRDGSIKDVFERTADRDLTKAKMRLTLRIAGMMSHALVVLGALGCGAFRNPPEEVATCWAEVVREPEFIGGRFRELCFAVWDKKNEGNFDIFKKTLDGLQL